MTSSSNNISVNAKTKSVFNTNCCVYGCRSRKGADRTIHFHSFPDKNSGIRVNITNEFGEEEYVDKRKAWEKVLLMTKPIGKYMRVCSKHFKKEDYCAKGVPMKQPKLKKYAVPSQNLPETRSYVGPTRTLQKQVPLVREEMSVCPNDIK